MRIGSDEDPGWPSSDDDDGEEEVDSAISRMSDVEMRRWVEQLVGIRRVDPGNLTLAAFDLGTRAGMDLSPLVPASSPAPSLETACTRNSESCGP